MDSRQLYVARQAGRYGRAMAGHIFAAALLLAGVAPAGAIPVAPVPSAASEAVVEQVQWPAWVETAGRREPVAPGQTLKVDDRLATGANARLLIRLADGSAVKLGEQAQLRIAALDERETGVLNAGLEVAKGAFRFTTGLFRQLLGKRVVQVRFPTLTIGVRGTDFWGKSDPQRELVLLLEGTVALSRHPDAQSAAVSEQRQLTTPLSYLFAVPGGTLQQRNASAEEARLWAQETEPDPARPSGSAGGGVSATIFGALTRPRAEALAGALRQRGYPVIVGDFAPAIDAASGRQRPRYAVLLPRLNNSAEAQLMRRELRRALQQSP